MTEKEKIANEYNLPKLVLDVRCFFKSQNKVAQYFGINKSIYSLVVRGCYEEISISTLEKACIKIQTFLAEHKPNGDEFDEDMVIYNLHKLAINSTYQDFSSYFKMIKQHFTMESFIFRGSK